MIKIGDSMETIIDFKVKNIIDDSNIYMIEEKCKNGIPLSLDETKELLDYISYQTRVKIAEHEGKNFEEYLFPMKCDLAQSMICYYLNDLGIKNNSINTNETIPNVTGHSLVIATINTIKGPKQYIVDPTYIQFFSKDKCTKERYTILRNIVCISPDPGYFVKFEHNEEKLMPLLEDGFIELNEETAKAYGDSFFRTKVSVQKEEILFNQAPGVNYIRWFNLYKSDLTKTKEELRDSNLLIGEEQVQKTR